jgi:adenine phosphoribosyltransferase
MDMDIKAHIRQVPDFPKPGILFYDISTLLAHPAAWRATVESMADLIKPWRPTILAGIESRGFLIAAPIALAMGLGFVMVRKKGKLPGKCVPHTYALEYGNDTIEVQDDAVPQGARVVLLDDLLATGGTLAAAGELLTKVGGEMVGAATIIELSFLKGRQRIKMPFKSLLTYDS